MSAPLTIRFATDHSAAKAGMQDLAASVVSNMVKVSDALNTGIQANGGYGATFKTLATNVGRDAASVANAGLTTAANSNLSIVATAGAMGKAAAETKTAGVAMTGAMAVVSAKAQFTYALIRNEASQTLKMLASSPLIIGAVTGGAGVIAGYALVKAAISQANEQIEHFIKLGQDAASAGVGVEFWQRFQEGAKKAKLDVAEVETALKHASTAVTPKFEEKNPIEKRLSEIFESGYTGDYKSKGLADYRAATTNDGRIRATITAMQEMKALGIELASLDVSEKMFGPDFTAKVRSGKVVIDDIAESLDRKRDDLIKQEEIDRAQEFNDRLEEAKRTIDEALHVSTSLAGAGQAVLDVWLKIVEQVAAASKVAGSFLDKMVAGAKAARDAQPPSALQSALASRLPEEGEGNLAADLGAVAGRSARGRTIYPEPIGPQRPVMTIANPPEPPRRPLSVILEQQHQGHEKAGGGAKDSFDAVETFINGLEKTAAAAKAEADAFGKSNAEKAAAIALAKLKETADQQGITVTEEQIAKVKAAAGATSTYRDKIVDLEQAQAKAAETARYFGSTIADSLGDAIFEGKSLQNIFLDISKMAGRGTLQALFTGQGPLASFLGTAPAASAGSSAVGGITGLFTSMFRANGGPVSAGQAYTVGEVGKEIFVPDQNGRVVPIARGGFGGGFGSGGGVQIIDQRTMAAPAPQVRQGPGGSQQIVLRDAEGAMYQRASRGQGPFAGAIGGAAGRRG